MQSKTVEIMFRVSELGQRPEVDLLETLLVEMESDGRWKVTQPGPDGHPSWVGRHVFQHAAILDYLKARLGIPGQDAEEQEWHALLAQPHVQAGLHRLAEEAMQQIAAGETEEGGFAVEDK